MNLKFKRRKDNSRRKYIARDLESRTNNNTEDFREIWKVVHKSNQIVLDCLVHRGVVDCLVHRGRGWRFFYN